MAVDTTGTHRVTWTRTAVKRLKIARGEPARVGDGYLSKNRYNVRWDGLKSFQQYAKPYIKPVTRLDAGEVWATVGRRGPLTIRLMERVVDYREDVSFRAEILAGKAKYVSDEYNMNQRAYGLGTVGSIISFRTTLTHLSKRRFDLE